MKTKSERCECGKGDVVFLKDGTKCCTYTLAKFEAVYGYPYGQQPIKKPGSV